MSLYAQIMALPCHPPVTWPHRQDDFRAGYDAARLAAAELALKAEAQPVPLSPLKDEQIDAIPFTGFDERRGHSETEALRMFARAALAEAEALTVAQPLPVAADSLMTHLQIQCSAWGTYWRASDAHGVELTRAQATELLAYALGVEVEIKS